MCQGHVLNFFSATGVQQGDPLAPFFFALALRIACKKVKEAVPEALSIWYLDDGVVAGTRQQVCSVWTILEKELGKVGLKLNPAKCEAWSPSGAHKDLPGVPSDVKKLATTGFELLGSPIGDDAFCDNLVFSRVDKIRNLLSHLDIVKDPQVELALVRSCCGMPCFRFALRTVLPDRWSHSIFR